MRHALRANRGRAPFRREDISRPQPCRNAVCSRVQYKEPWVAAKGSESAGGRTHSKDALEAGLEALERSFDAAGQGSLVLNHKLIEIPQRNVNSGFTITKSLAAAKTLSEVVEVQAAYWGNWLGTFAAQAEELRALSAKVTDDTAEPIKAHVTRGMNELRKAS